MTVEAGKQYLLQNKVVEVVYIVDWNDGHFSACIRGDDTERFVRVEELKSLTEIGKLLYENKRD